MWYGAFLSEKKYSLIPHVENEVNDGEVGKETVFLLKHLVVSLRMEVIHRCDTCVCSRPFHLWIDVEQFATC